MPGGCSFEIIKSCIVPSHFVQDCKSFNITFLDTDGMVHWSSGRTVKSYYEPPPADVEMTSYGLMTYISGLDKDTLSAAPIIRWLSKQRNSLGGFASTQVSFRIL